MVKKRKLQQSEPRDNTTSPELPPAKVSSDQLQPVAKKGKWTNKQRVLIFCSRGIGYRGRHLMVDLRTMMPHSKPDTKMNKKDKLFVINEMAEMKNCTKVLYFECRKRADLYLWAAATPGGPSAKFLIENVHTTEELKMTGNCLRSSRPLLSFDKHFDTEPHYALLKELFTQTFGTPKNHPKSQPFFDHVFTFSVIDGRIWFRNYQIVEEDGSLAEIGPRFTLNPMKIFTGSFGGAVLYENPDYVSPNTHRRLLRKQAAGKYINRVHASKSLEDRQAAAKDCYPKDVTDDVFVTIDRKAVA